MTESSGSSVLSERAKREVVYNAVVDLLSSQGLKPLTWGQVFFIAVIQEKVVVEEEFAEFMGGFVLNYESMRNALSGKINYYTNKRLIKFNVDRSTLYLPDFTGIVNSYMRFSAVDHMRESQYISYVTDMVVSLIKNLEKVFSSFTGENHEELNKMMKKFSLSNKMTRGGATRGFLKNSVTKKDDMGINAAMQVLYSLMVLSMFDDRSVKYSVKNAISIATSGKMASGGKTGTGHAGGHVGKS